MRWTETRDSYRATLLSGGVLFVLSILVLLLMAASVWAAINTSSRATVSGLPLVLGIWAFGACMAIILVWGCASWVEFPLRGGPVTWGHGSYRDGQTPTAVKLFDVEMVVDSPNYYRLVAILDDGQTRQAMDTLYAGNPATLTALVRQMNPHGGAGVES